MKIYVLIRHYDESSQVLMVTFDFEVARRERELWMKQDRVSDFETQVWCDNQIVHEQTWRDGRFVTESYTEFKNA